MRRLRHGGAPALSCDGRTARRDRGADADGACDNSTSAVLTLGASGDIRSGMPKVCAQCGGPLAHPNQRFCSHECRFASLPSKACEQCGQTFPLKNNKTQRFCSTACKSIALTTDKPTLTCEKCAKPFQGASGRKFCSTKCQALAYSQTHERSAAKATPDQYTGKKRARLAWKLNGDLA